MLDASIMTSKRMDGPGELRQTEGTMANKSDGCNEGMGALTRWTWSPKLPQNVANSYVARTMTLAKTSSA